MERKGDNGRLLMDDRRHAGHSAHPTPLQPVGNQHVSLLAPQSHTAAKQSASGYSPHRDKRVISLRTCFVVRSLSIEENVSPQAASRLPINRWSKLYTDC